MPAFRFASVLILGLCLLPLLGLINPGLQPRDLCDRYRAVVLLTSLGIDPAAGTATLAVSEVLCGATDLKQVVIHRGGKPVGTELVLGLEKGTQMLAFVSQKVRRGDPGERRILVYNGGKTWFILEAGEADRAVWTVQRNADDDAPNDKGIMFGTFNGRIGRLAELARDHARGESYFPAVPVASYSERVLGRCPGAVHGVALADLDGDGRLDAYAASSAGDRLLLAGADGAWNDATAARGLAERRSRSVCAGDADGDGRADLLLDATLWRQQEDGRFAAVAGLPAPGAEVRSATLADADGDGDLDVLVSLAGAGLRLWRNDRMAFVDGTAAAGLADARLAAGDGYFDVGDVDGDGRLDIVYGIAGGMLLRGGGQGAFTAAVLNADPDDGDFAGQRLGAPAFGAWWRHEATSILLPWDQGNQLLALRSDGTIDDVTRSGNELQEPASGQLMALGVDLEADGTEDLIVTSPQQGGGLRLTGNRGYGSFMMTEKNRGARAVLPPQATAAAIRGLAAADVDGDGGEDLLAGCEDGAVLLLRSEVVAARPPKPDRTRPYHEQRQAGTGFVDVRVSGPGARGAMVEVLRAGRPVQLRRLGGSVGIGCSAPPDRLTLALRDGGEHTVRVIRSDGRRQEAVVTPAARTVQTLRFAP